MHNYWFSLIGLFSCYGLYMSNWDLLFSLIVEITNCINWENTNLVNTFLAIKYFESILKII